MWEQFHIWYLKLRRNLPCVLLPCRHISHSSRYYIKFIHLIHEKIQENGFDPNLKLLGGFHVLEISQSSWRPPLPMLFSCGPSKVHWDLFSGGPQFIMFLRIKWVSGLAINRQNHGRETKLRRPLVASWFKCRNGCDFQLRFLRPEAGAILVLMGSA